MTTHLQQACAASGGAVDYARIGSRLFRIDPEAFDGEKLSAADQDYNCIVEAADFGGDEYKVAEAYIAAARDPRWQQFGARNLYGWATWASAIDQMWDIKREIYKAPSTSMNSSGCHANAGMCSRYFTSFESTDWDRIVSPREQELRDAVAQMCAGPGEGNPAGRKFSTSDTLPETIAVEKLPYIHQRELASWANLLPVADYECRGAGCPERGGWIFIRPCY